MSIVLYGFASLQFQLISVVGHTLASNHPEVTGITRVQDFAVMRHTHCEIQLATQLPAICCLVFAPLPLDR